MPLRRRPRMHTHRPDPPFVCLALRPPPRESPSAAGLAGARGRRPSPPAEVKSRDRFLTLRWLRGQQDPESGCVRRRIDRTDSDRAARLRRSARGTIAARTAPSSRAPSSFLASANSAPTARFPNTRPPPPDRIEARTATALAALQALGEPEGDGSMTARALAYLGDQCRTPAWHSTSCREPESVEAAAQRVTIS